jgi:site-specific DNA-methyltransferase (adenine-specific)
MAEQKAFCMDCMEAMRDMPDKAFELAIVDPPYRDENQPTKDMRASGSMKSLEGRPTEEYWQELYRVSVNQIIWGANNFQLPQFKGFVVWEKGIPEKFTMSMSEIASLSEGLGTISKIYKCRASGQGDRIHPTQKPVALYEWLLTNYAKPGDKILDTHLGSGSSRIAAYNLGFDFVGYEIDKDYFDAQEERFKKHTAQVRLFDLAPKQETEQLQII